MPKIINVRVTPKAKLNKIKKETLECGSVLYRVHLTTAPEDGKANKTLIEMLAKYFKISKSDISIVKGRISRNKIIEIA